MLHRHFEKRREEAAKKTAEVKELPAEQAEPETEKKETTRRRKTAK